MSPRLRHDEEGQGLVEFALVLPMLIVLMAGVVYCGGLVASQQGLAIAARGAARAMAIKATEDGLKNALGEGGKASEAEGKKAMNAAMPNGGVTMSGVSWGALGAGVAGRGYAGAFTKTGSVTLGKDIQSAKCGIGVAYYGATVKRDMSRDLGAIGRIGGLSAALTPSLSATSVMPAELPIHGRASMLGGGPPGVLELNPWIGKIVNRKYTKKSFD